MMKGRARGPVVGAASGVAKGGAVDAGVVRFADHGAGGTRGAGGDEHAETDRSICAKPDRQRETPGEQDAAAEAIGDGGGLSLRSAAPCTACRSACRTGSCRRRCTSTMMAAAAYLVVAIAVVAVGSSSASRR